MNYKEFIKLEAKVLLNSGLNQDMIFELFNDGLAEDLRYFAEKNNYDIKEADLQRLIIWKLYKKYYQT